MFDWFWEFLYMISKTLFKLIDGLILCANKLCGIDPINFEGEESDFLTHLIFSDEISLAFKVSAILATILLVIFTVFMIIRSIAKDKSEGTPAQIAVKAFKTLLMFFFIPLVMLAFMTIGNAFVKALYAATMQTSASPGAFLFSAFAEDGGMDPEIAARFRTGKLDYYNTSVVSSNMILSEFPFIFSFIAGGVVLYGIGSAMLTFVDRVLSLVILYIAAPISISTSVLDDGARFKLWREQFLSKFIMGYGMILAVNIYALVCGIIMDPDLVFFSGDNASFLNLLMRLLIIAGGALTLQKAMALIGNLVSSGAGSNELRDSVSAGAVARMAMGVGGKALGIASGIAFNNPLAKVGKSIVGDAASMKSRDWGSKLLDKVGLGVGDNDKGKESSGAQNDNKANYGSDPNSAKNAINDSGFKPSNWDTKEKGSGNANNNKANQNKNEVGKAIDNSNKGNGNQNQQPQQNQQEQQAQDGGANN